MQVCTDTEIYTYHTDTVFCISSNINVSIAPLATKIKHILNEMGNAFQVDLFYSRISTITSFVSLTHTPHTPPLSRLLECLMPGEERGQSVMEKEGGAAECQWSCYHGEHAAHNPARTFREHMETVAQPHSSKCGPGAFLPRCPLVEGRCPGTLPAACSQVTSAYALSSLVIKSQRLGEGRDNLQFVPEVHATWSMHTAGHM